MEEYELTVYYYNDPEPQKFLFTHLKTIKETFTSWLKIIHTGNKTCIILSKMDIRRYDTKLAEKPLRGRA